jgi:hypothetical protein
MPPGSERERRTPQVRLFLAQDGRTLPWELVRKVFQYVDKLTAYDVFWAPEDLPPPPKALGMPDDSRRSRERAWKWRNRPSYLCRLADVYYDPATRTGLCDMLRAGFVHCERRVVELYLLTAYMQGWPMPDASRQADLMQYVGKFASFQYSVGVVLPDTPKMCTRDVIIVVPFSPLEIRLATEHVEAGRGRVRMRVLFDYCSRKGDAALEHAVDALLAGQRLAALGSVELWFSFTGVITPDNKARVERLFAALIAKLQERVPAHLTIAPGAHRPAAARLR